MTHDRTRSGPVLDTSTRADGGARKVEPHKPDLLLTEEHHMCPGCGEPLAVRRFLEAISELGVARARDRASPASAATRSFSATMDVDLVQALHGRAPSVATGVKRMLPDALVFTLQGDGDMVNEGLQEVLHTAARGERVTCILLNNGVFGETGGHMTATTVIGQRTKNSLDGRDAEYHGYPILIGDLHRAARRARRTSRAARCTTRARWRGRSDVPARVRDAGSRARASRSSRCSRCARPAGSSRPPRAPTTCSETLGEVHIMGELKVDGVVRTTEELHAENVAQAARDRGSARRAAGSTRTPVDGLHATRPRPRRSATSSAPGSTRTCTDEYRGDGHRRCSMDDGRRTLATLRAWNRDARRRRATRRSRGPRSTAGAAPGVMEQVVFAEEMHRAERAGHAEPARPVEHRAGDHRARHRRAEAQRSSPACCAATTSGARDSPSPTRAPTSRRCARRAVRDGDDWSSTGRRRGTRSGTSPTGASCSCAPIPTAPKHKGITCLLVDMTLPGVEVRPLITITGEQRVQRDLLHRRARARSTAMLGPVNEGWRVAMTTLALRARHASPSCTSGRARRSSGCSTWRGRRRCGDGRTAADDPVLRQQLARVYLEGELLKLVSDRAISAELHGRAHRPRGQHRQAACGARPSSTSPRSRATCSAPTPTRGAVGPRPRRQPRSLTIAGGTTQVNKNIIAQRILGLPRS